MMVLEKLKQPLTWAFIGSGAAIGFAVGFISGRKTAKPETMDYVDERKLGAIEKLEESRSYSKEEAIVELADRLQGTPYHEWADKKAKGAKVAPDDDKPSMEDVLSSYSTAVVDEEAELDESEVDGEVNPIKEGFREDAIERISQEEYLNGNPFNEKVPCTYFNDEGVLAGGEDLAQMDVGDTIGESNLHILTSGQEDVVWVRNNELGEDYEVSLSNVPLVEAMEELVTGYLDSLDDNEVEG